MSRLSCPDKDNIPQTRTRRSKMFCLSLISPATYDLHVAALAKGPSDHMLSFVQCDRGKGVLDKDIKVISIKLHLLFHLSPVCDCTRFDNHDITPLPLMFVFIVPSYCVVSREPRRSPHLKRRRESCRLRYRRQTLRSLRLTSRRECDRGDSRNPMLLARSSLLRSSIQ